MSVFRTTGFPLNIRTLRKLYGVPDPGTASDTFISCPTCHCLYDLDYHRPLSIINPLPPKFTVPQPPWCSTLEAQSRLNSIIAGCSPAVFRQQPANLDPAHATCTYQRTPGSATCQTPLFRKDPRWRLYDDPLRRRPGFVPERVVVYQRLRPWLEDLLTRPGIRESLCHVAVPNDGEVTDIWESAEFLRLSHQPGFFLDGKNPNNTTLVFGLFVDWCNPDTNKLGGKHRSDGSIYLVLLNLPHHIRFHHRHLFTCATIPGPKEPDYDQVSHILRHVVNEVDSLQRDPLRIEHVDATFVNYLALLILGIFDTLAHRKCTGATSHRHATFPCNCFATASTLGSLQVDLNTRYTLEEHRGIALLWRCAASEADQEWIEEHYGVRWCELLRLFNSASLGAGQSELV